MGIEQQQYGITDNFLTALVYFADEVTGKPYPKAARIPGIPRLFSHLLPRGLEPRDVLNALAMNGPALEEFAALKHRLGTLEMGQRAHEFMPRLLLASELPVEPGQLVILAIGIIVALLTMADLVASQEHRHTL